MLKNILCAIMICSILLLTNCGKKSDDGGDGDASTPLSASCLNGTTTCNNNEYGQPYNYGYRPYPANYQYRGWCGCPGGTYPVYNGTIGAGCVNYNLVQPYIQSGFYFYINAQLNLTPYNPWPGSYMTQTYAPNNNHFVNIPQVAGAQGYQNGMNSCHGGAMLSCYVDQPGTCTSGYTCRPTSGASRLGVCAR